MQKTRGITTIGMTAVLLWACGTALAKVEHCTAHGVSVTDEVKVGDPIQASVTFDSVPADGTKPADLGSRKVGDKIAIAVTLWDTDNHVCKVEPKNQTVKAAMKSQDLKAQAYTVDSSGNNKMPVGNPVDVKVTGTDTDKKLSLAGTIEVDSSWAGNYILICLQGKAEDEYCSYHPSATDTPLDMSKYMAKCYVPDLTISPESSTPWLVIEDESSPGAGPDQKDKPIQKAENQATISYAILPDGAFVPKSVVLELVGTDYKQNLPLLTGSQTATIETRDGRLKGKDASGNDVWYPAQGNTCFPQGKYPVRITMTDPSGNSYSAQYDGLIVKPLMSKLAFTPDIAADSPEKICPYWDEVSAGEGKGCGLGLKYDLLDDLNVLKVHFQGGDIGGTKEMIVGETNLIKRTSAAGKWEGYDVQIDEKIDEIWSYPNEQTGNKKAPERVIKEGAGYELGIEMSRKADPTQKQTFTVPFAVEYKSH